MECRNEQIAALLPDYVTGHLAPDDESRMQEHLESCEVCRDSLATLRLMMPVDRTGVKSHPAKLLLAQYYRDRSSLSPEIADLLQKHLADCRDCAGELGILEDMERELRRSVAAGEHASGRIARWAGVYGRYIAYAAAASLLLMAGYRVLVTEDQGVAVSQVYRLSEAARSVADLPEVHVSADTRSVVLEVPFFHAQADNDYSVYLTDVQGQGIITTFPHIEYAQTGLLRVRLDASALSGGRYQLVVKETKRGSTHESSQTYFPFQLIKASD